MTDGLGSVVASFSNTAGSAAVLGNQTYEPYGKSQYQQGSMGTSKGYTGQYTDNLSGLDYYGARYYDPVAGVFLSPDSVQGNESGMNPYAYVAGNPETLTDPTGQRIADCWNPQCGGFGEAGNSSITTIERPPAPSSPSSPSSSSGGPCSGWKAIICAIIAWAATHPPAQTENATNDHSSVGAATPPAPWGNGDPFVNNQDMPDDISTTQALSFPAQSASAGNGAPQPLAGGSAGGPGGPPPRKPSTPPLGPGPGRMDPRDVYFSQETCSSGGAGYTVEQNIAALKEGSLTPDDIPPIRVFQKEPWMNDWGPASRYGHEGDPGNLVDGRWYTLDNRRLLAFLEAGITDIPVEDVSNNTLLIRSQRWKFSTTDGGESIVCE